MDAGVSEASSDQRMVRVFVSSTFRDMQAERDELVKRTFPLLRRLCDERGVVWGEVDLRWGITEEERAEGRVLPLCLAEIDRSRPYFLCFLGERYGWVADNLEDDLVAREPWLADHLNQSVTELEILHGVLNNPAMAAHAFFYFRDPSYIDTLAPETQPAYREVATDDEVRRHGRAGAERRAAERRSRLQALKERIRAGGFPVRTYADPLAVAELVEEDLAAVIDQRFPAGSAPEGLDREATAHEAFASSRARVYIARKDDFARLDAHASGDGPPPRGCRRVGRG